MRHACRQLLQTSCGELALGTEVGCLCGAISTLYTLPLWDNTIGIDTASLGNTIGILGNNYTVKNINGKYRKIARHFFSRTNIVKPTFRYVRHKNGIFFDRHCFLSVVENRKFRTTTYVRAVIILLDVLPDVELSNLQCELHTSGLDILPYTLLTASAKLYLALARIELLTERLSISASSHLDHYTTDETNMVMQFQLAL